LTDPQNVKGKSRKQIGTQMIGVEGRFPPSAEGKERKNKLSMEKRHMGAKAKKRRRTGGTGKIGKTRRWDNGSFTLHCRWGGAAGKK